MMGIYVNGSSPVIQLWHVVAGSHEITFNARDDKVPPSLAPGSAEGMAWVLDSQVERYIAAAMILDDLCTWYTVSTELLHPMRQSTQIDVYIYI